MEKGRLRRRLSLNNWRVYWRCSQTLQWNPVAVQEATDTAQNTGYLNIRKLFFIVKVTEHCRKLPRYVVESLSPEILKSHMDSPWQLAPGSPAWVGGVDQAMSRHFFKAQLFCGFNVYISNHSQIFSSNMKLTVKSSYVQWHLKSDNMIPPFLNMLIFL